MNAAVETCYFVDGVHYGRPGCHHEQFPEQYPSGWNVQLQDFGRDSAYWNGQSPDQGNE